MRCSVHCDKWASLGMSCKRTREQQSPIPTLMIHRKSTQISSHHPLAHMVWRFVQGRLDCSLAQSLSRPRIYTPSLSSNMTPQSWTQSLPVHGRSNPLNPSGFHNKKGKTPWALTLELLAPCNVNVPRSSK